MKIGLDQSGGVVNSEKTLSTYPGFDDQVLSAVLWSEFAPARIRGESVASSAYLLVSLFPYLDYPTEIWSGEESAEQGLFERMRVRMVPDTVGLLCKPIPRAASPGSLSVGRRYLHLIDTVTSFIAIDTDGKAEFRRCSSRDPKAIQAVREIVGELDFFPALDYRGEPCSFGGVVRLSFANGTIVRIRYEWLP